MLISNDLMRDHLFELLRPRHFLKWRTHHQFRIVACAPGQTLDEALRVDAAHDIKSVGNKTQRKQYRREQGAPAASSAQPVQDGAQATVATDLRETTAVVVASTQGDQDAGQAPAPDAVAAADDAAPQQRARALDERVFPTQSGPDDAFADLFSTDAQQASDGDAADVEGTAIADMAPDETGNQAGAGDATAAQARRQKPPVANELQIIAPPQFTTCVQLLKETGTWMIPGPDNRWLCARPIAARAWHERE